MSQRVVVMNGQRLFQTEHGGQWRTDRVDKAGNLKPGLYRLDAALPADQSRIHPGVIVHADRQFVYQQAGSMLRRHAAAAFDVLPRAEPRRRSPTPVDAPIASPLPNQYAVA